MHRYNIAMQEYEKAAKEKNAQNQPAAGPGKVKVKG
jgi:hypothetical protein